MGTPQRHIKGHVTACPSPLQYQPSTEVILHSLEILLCRTLPSGSFQQSRWVEAFEFDAGILGGEAPVCAIVCLILETGMERHEDGVVLGSTRLSGSLRLHR
jgi:hypothetical protein